MWRVVFPKTLYDDMQELLFRTAPEENGCFLLTNHYATRSRVDVVTVSKTIAPDSTSWKRHGPGSLEPTTSFINKAAVEADFLGSGIFFVHTHPAELHPATQSPVDAHTDNLLFANLGEILPSRPLGSLILSRKGLTGVIFSKEWRARINEFRVVGTTISAPAPKTDTAGEAEFDRQVRAVGVAKHAMLRKTRACVVGAGGTGSAVAVQLARMGVKNLVLIDPDRLDRTNLSRVYGATPRDVGRPKVAVLKRHIESFSKTTVEAIDSTVLAKELLPVLADCDFVFGCTDDLTSRAVLNDVSIQYYIPLIDIGCRISLGKDGDAEQVIAKVQAVTPDSACLWCTGTLDANAILQESFSANEKRKLAAEGYYQPVDRQPSVVSLTTLGASIGVTKVLDLLGVFGEKYDTRTQIELKDWFMVSDSPEIKGNCVCLERRGMGDNRKILG